MNIIIIMSGGVGNRFGADIPKQYCHLRGRPVIDYVIDAAKGSKVADKVVVVADPSCIELSDALKNSGFDFAVNGKERLDSLKSAFDHINKNYPDCEGIIILDAVGPFVTSELIDDYLTKPFSVEELLARLRATLRRLAAAENGDFAGGAIFENGELKIDYAAGCAYLSGEELHLTPIEYKLLCLLARNVGKVLTHTYITGKIWGRSWDSDIASLRVFMATLRKKLQPDPTSPEYIQTHIGVGYRMVKV